MGTHPIFESDFDCLTECCEKKSESDGSICSESTRRRKKERSGKGRTSLNEHCRKTNRYLLSYRKTRSSYKRRSSMTTRERRNFRTLTTSTNTRASRTLR